MAKDKFKRANVKSTILKNVIIRMDFIGLTDIVGCVNSLKDVMYGKFNKFSPINKDNYNIELPRENSMRVPNVNLEKRTFYQFSDSQIGTSRADFMLGADFAAMKVECDSRYEGCDDYIKLMADAIDCILRFDTFMSTQTSDNNKRIAKNTLLLYFRMLFMMVVSLYASRVILDMSWM